MKVLVSLILFLTFLISQAQPINPKSIFEINGHKFKVNYYESGDDFQVLLSTKIGKDWVTQLTDRVEIFGNIKFSLWDVNNDRFSDLLVGFRGYPGRKHLYLFDPDKNKFVEVEGYENYPEPKPVKSSSKYYYSYSRSGCDGKVWNSDLFYINGHNVEVVGNIKGNGCGGLDDIQVLRIGPDDKKMIANLSLHESLLPFDNGKYGFLEDYWAQNLEKFRQE